MSAERVLHVCYDPALLIVREQLLTRTGYGVVTVLGTDGVMAGTQLSDYSVVVIGDGATVAERKAAVQWIKRHSPLTLVVALCGPDESIPEADYQASTQGPEAWLRSVVECIERDTDSA